MGIFSPPAVLPAIRFSGYLDVTQNGVSSTSPGTDQATAIQACIALGAAQGKFLYFPAGTYSWNTNLNWVNGCPGVIGESNQTTIFQPTSLTNSCFYILSCNNVTFSNLQWNFGTTFVGTNISAYQGGPIVGKLCNDIKVDNCIFQNCPLGVIFQYTKRIQYTNNVFKNCFHDSLHMDACEDFLIAYNSIYGSGDDAIAMIGYNSGQVIGRCKRGIVVGNRINSSKAARGIAVSGGEEIIIFGNTIINPYAAGIYCWNEGATLGNENITIEANMLDGCGIVSNWSVNQGNLSSGNPYYYPNTGVSIQALMVGSSGSYAARNIKVVNNTVKNSCGIGIAVFGANFDVLISGNTITNTWDPYNKGGIQRQTNSGSTVNTTGTVAAPVNYTFKLNHIWGIHGGQTVFCPANSGSNPGSILGTVVSAQVNAGVDCQVVIACVQTAAIANGSNLNFKSATFSTQSASQLNGGDNVFNGGFLGSTQITSSSGTTNTLTFPSTWNLANADYSLSNAAGTIVSGIQPSQDPCAIYVGAVCNAGGVVSVVTGVTATTCTLSQSVTLSGSSVSFAPPCFLSQLLTAAITATTTSGTNTITATGGGSPTTAAIGCPLIGTSYYPGTFITNISGNTITLSQNASATNTNVSSAFDVGLPGAGSVGVYLQNCTDLVLDNNTINYSGQNAILGFESSFGGHIKITNNNIDNYNVAAAYANGYRYDTTTFAADTTMEISGNYFKVPRNWPKQSGGTILLNSANQPRIVAARNISQLYSGTAFATYVASTTPTAITLTPNPTYWQNTSISPVEVYVVGGNVVTIGIYDRYATYVTTPVGSGQGLYFLQPNAIMQIGWVTTAPTVSYLPQLLP